MAQLAAARIEALQLVAGNVAVVERLLVRVPDRRFTQLRGRCNGQAHLCGGPHQTTATSSFIEASKVSPGAKVRRPCAAGSAMWIAFDTWLTCSTQK